MSMLGERYRSLLFAYPEEYRSTHEEEILTTLLDGAAPGQRWPNAREAAGLLVGGLSTRARIAAAEGSRAIWSDGLRLGALLLLCSLTSDAIQGSMGQPGLSLWLVSILLGAACVLVVRGMPRAAVAAIVVAALVESRVRPDVMSTPFRTFQLLATQRLYHLLAAVAVAGILLWLARGGRGRQPWSWAVAALALACTVAYAHVVPVLETGGARNWHDFRFPVPLSLFELVLPVGALSLVTLLARDARPGIAAAIYVEAHLAARLLIVLGQPFLYGPQTMQILILSDVQWWQYVVAPFVVPAALVLITLASAVVSYRRAADT